MKTQQKIVIVDNDPREAAAIARSLAEEDYRAAVATNGAELWRLCRQEAADLVLLDLNLAEDDGIDLARQLTATTSAAVIILTGRAELQDRIEGFEAGADDYIIKPFETAELLARVRAVLRRRAAMLDPQGPVRLGAYRLDPATLLLTREAEAGLPAASARLTATEARLMSMLMRQYGRAVSRASLRQREEVSLDDRSIDVHIGHIRRKLREAGMDEMVLWSVRGFGYRLRLEATISSSRPPPGEGS